MVNAKERKSQRKILSFSTTMRNPYRIGKFLVAIATYKDKVLTHEVIMDIVKLVLNYRLYTPMFIKHDKILKDKFDDENYNFSNEELELIIKNSPQNHKESGFEHGWESRFDTWFKLMSELGFCYYAKNEKIIISQSGQMLIDAFFDKKMKVFKDSYDESLAGAVFLNAFSRYEVGNPYKKNLNHNKPFRLLLKLLIKLKSSNQKPLNIKEIPILLCWQNDDENELYGYICSLRNEIYSLTGAKFAYSDEFIYEKCLFLLESDNIKRFKASQILVEAVDEYIRKMRITGLISLRGGGRFIDINTNEIKKVEYVCGMNDSFSGDYLDSSSVNKMRFFEYMSFVDTFLTTATAISDDSDIKIIKLKDVAKNYQSNVIENELLIICNKGKTSKDDFFKLIDKPLRFEFLTAVYMVQKFKDINVVPNYKSDDEGNPIFTASGGNADIIAYDKDTESYIEVTLLKDRSQVANEMIPIERHLDEYIKSSDNDKLKFSVFVAPSIHDDAKRYAKFAKFDKNLNIPYYGIDEFITKVSSSEKLNQLNDESLLRAK